MSTKIPAKPTPARMTSPEERAPLYAAYAASRRRGEEIGFRCPDDSIIQYAVRAYDEAKYGTEALSLPDWLVDLIHAAATSEGCTWEALYRAVPQHTKVLVEQARTLRAGR